MMPRFFVTPGTAPNHGYGARGLWGPQPGSLLPRVADNSREAWLNTSMPMSPCRGVHGERVLKWLYVFHLLHGSSRLSGAHNSVMARSEEKLDN